MGIGILNPAIADAAVGTVPKEQSGMASGINDTFRQVGISVGIATWGAIFLSRGADKVVEVVGPGTPAALGERPRELVEATSSGALDQALTAVPEPAQATVSLAATEGFLAGINEILLLGGAALLRRRPRRALARPRGRDRARAHGRRFGRGGRARARRRLTPFRSPRRLTRRGAPERHAGRVAASERTGVRA